MCPAALGGERSGGARCQSSLTADLLFTALTAPARVCFLPPSAFRFLLKVACLDLAPKTVRERRHRGHRRGGVVCLPYPSAALGSPGAAPLPAVTGAVLAPAGGCTAPLLLLLLCSLLARGCFREVLGTKPAGLLGVLEFNPARCPSSTTCIYGNFLIWKIVYVFLRTAWEKIYCNYIPGGF